MERKNIFQLVEENYDINAEIKKINKLFVYENYFKNAYTSEYTLKQLTDAIFSKWEFAGTCLNSDEFLKKANAEIDIYGRNSAEDKIKNNLEALENFLSCSIITPLRKVFFVKIITKISLCQLFY